MKFNPTSKIQDLLFFGEFGGVNPSITDSSTFTFLNQKKMEEAFEVEMEGCFLYSRHWNPINKYLSTALAALEDMEGASVTSSGMAAISNVLIQICSQGDEIVSSQTIYGGTYALMKNVLPKFGITTHFVDINDLQSLEKKINPKTKIIFCEFMSNPLLQIAAISEISKISKKSNTLFVVDNTFTPMIMTPGHHGADIVVHSLTKFINGTSDCVAGVICSNSEFISQLSDVNSGACMLFGPVLDSFRSASIMKNLHDLHLRIQKHSDNALFLANKLKELGLKVHYPGLEEHPQHALFKNLKNEGFGYGGMMTIDVNTHENAGRVMELWQEEKVGYLAVSLGSYKTLFSSPGISTSSEIPKDKQTEMGLSPGLVRVSVGLDQDIGVSFERMKSCLDKIKL
jgi:methionine-gamma-lyase